MSLDTYVWRRDGVSIPWDTKHAVTARFYDELVLACLHNAPRYDVLHAPVPAVASSDTLERSPVRSIDHRFAAGVKFDYMYPNKTLCMAETVRTYTVHARTESSMWEC